MVYLVMWPQKLLPIFCLVLIVFALLRCTVRVAMSRLLLSFFFVCVLVGESIKVIAAYHSFLSFALVGITWKRLPLFHSDVGSSLKSLNDRFYQTLEANSAVACFRLTNATNQIGCSGTQIILFLRVEDGPWVSALFNLCAVCMYIYMCVFM